MLTNKPTLKKPGASGVVLIAVLIWLSIATFVITGMVELQHTQAKREKEVQLLFVGDQYRRAIASYYATVPAGKTQSLPQTLEDLLQDSRSPIPVRHLRRLYVDPITTRPDWILITGPSGIVGVRSNSTAIPLKKTGFPSQFTYFSNAATYSDWNFEVPLR